MQKTLNWNIIYVENSPKLLGICRRYVSDLAAAEDIVQDSFIAAIQNQNQLKNENALFGWLKKIVVNNSLQYLRKNGNKVFQDIETENIEFQEETDESDFLSKQFSAEQMLTCIDQLPSHHKAVFNLFFLENYSHEEISQELGINVNTSKSHLLRAKKSIKTKLMEKHTEPSLLKRKGIQLLVFLGFGNLLWAKNLNSTFSDFKISPKKDFQTELNNAQPFKVETGGKLGFSLGKGITYALCIGVGLMIFVFTSNLFSTDENAQPKVATKELKQNPVPEKTISENEIVSSENPKTKTNNQEESRTSIAPPISSENEIQTKKSKFPLGNKKENLMVESKSTEKLKTSTIATQDSAKIKPKPVVIKKKIIKRDTVYIER